MMPAAIDCYGREPLLLQPDWVRSWVIGETDDYIALNKPGWVVCHPSKNGPWSSLVGAAREVFGLDRIHLVSRLDRETSGIVLLAKNHACASRFQTAFAERRTRKVYHAILRGHLGAAQTATSNLDRDRASPVAVQQAITFGGRGKPAETRFRPLRHLPDHTLAEVIPVTGRKHQIRAHAAWLGHPVAGDKIYGGDPTCYLEFIEQGWTPRLQAALGIPRQALHAASLTVHGPGFKLTLEAPCPFAEEGFLEALAANARERDAG